MTVTTWKSVGSEIDCLTNLIIARLYGLAMGLCHWREGIFFTPMDRMDRMGFDAETRRRRGAENEASVWAGGAPYGNWNRMPSSGIVRWLW